MAVIEQAVDGGPFASMPDLEQGGGLAQLHPASGQPVRHGIPVAFVDDMAVAGDLPRPDPFAGLVGHSGQRDHRRPLLRFERGETTAFTFPERRGVVRVEPFAYRQVQLIERVELPVAHRSDDGAFGVQDEVLAAGLVLRLLHPARQHRRGVVFGEVAVVVVQHDLAIAGMAHDPGLEVAAHDPGRNRAEIAEHEHMAVQPRGFAHVAGRMHERVTAERQAPDEQVRLRRLSGDRVMDRHDRPGPVDLDRTPGLALDPRGDAQAQHVIGVQFAEPVVAHERNPLHPARVRVLRMQQPQRDAHTPQFAVHARPVGLLVGTLYYAPAGKQQGVHLVIGFALHVTVGDVKPVGGVEHVDHAVLRHTVAHGYRVARQSLLAKPEHELRLDSAYHRWHSFRHASIAWMEGA